MHPKPFVCEYNKFSKYKRTNTEHMYVIVSRMEGGVGVGERCAVPEPEASQYQGERTEGGVVLSC